MDLKKRLSQVLRHFGKQIPDKLYLRLLFYAEMGYSLSLKKPLTFNEKLQWLKLYNRNPKYTDIVDKVKVKDIVANTIGQEYIIPTFAVWQSTDQIDFSTLPSNFVLKTNNGGGNSAVFLINDKSTIDIETIKRQLKKALATSIYNRYREWPYKNIEKCIFAEELLGTNIEDYKFFCFDGYVDSVMVCSERNSGNTKFYFFNSEWKLLKYNIRGKEAPENFSLPKPTNLNKMFEIASVLSKGKPFVRIDLYNIEGKIYFGEMTFYPASGLDRNLLKETDKYFGDLINLNNYIS